VAVEAQQVQAQTAEIQPVQALLALAAASLVLAAEVVD
jgi:hypothetical protein